MSAGRRETEREREGGRRRERSEGWEKVCVLEGYKLSTLVSGLVEFHRGKKI